MKIPYNEQAKICAMNDMNELARLKRQEEAISVFNDIRDFFETENNTVYLSTILSKENMEKVLNKIEAIFIEMEDYERCHCIVEWRKQFKNIHKE